MVADRELVDGRRALLAAHIVSYISKIREEALSSIFDKAAKEVLFKDKLEMLPDAETLQEMKMANIVHNCSFARMSGDVYEDLKSEIRVEINQAPFPCDVIRANPKTLAMRPASFDSSLKDSISQWRKSLEARIEAETRVALQRALDDPARASTSAITLADEAIPRDIRLGRKHCRTASVSSWGNCATNWGKEKAERVYRDRRARARRSYESATRGAALDAQIQAATLVLAARLEARSELDSAETDLRTAVEEVAEAMRVAQVVLLFLLVVALIKSFLYVLGLLLFRVEGSAPVCVDGSSRIQGSTPVVGYGADEIPINVEAKRVLITKARLTNQRQQTIFPIRWGLASVLSRILYRKVTFNRGAPVPGSTILFNEGHAKHCILWKLRDGEEVIFHPRSFFGATENVKFRSRVSLRLSTLLLGRMIFHSAHAVGEAYLLLVAEGNIGKQSTLQDKVENASASTLVAWHPHTCFRVQNQLTIWSVLNDNYTLERVRYPGVSSGRVVVAAPNGNVIPFAGTFRFLWRLLGPF
jgi:uncharacterized protein (AIM24 family)